jgi:hypothetical protein
LGKNFRRRFSDKTNFNHQKRFTNCLNKSNRKNLTLTVRGFTVRCTADRTTAVEKFDWGNALIDAVITSGITFFSALAGSAMAGDVTEVHIIETAIVAAFSQFFVFLALKRGLVKHSESQNQ